MDDFDRVHGKFELLLRSANRGDSRALKMAKRAVNQMKQLAESRYFTRSGPRVLRKSYNLEFWMMKQTRRSKIWTLSLVPILAQLLMFINGWIQK